MSAHVVAIVALSLMLACASGAAVVAVWSAKASHITAKEAIGDRRAAVDLLIAERKYSVALETYLPGQSNEGLYTPTGGVGYIDIVFDGPPEAEAGRFVEVEDETGASISFGEWVQRPDGYWALRLNEPTLRGCA